MTSHQQHCGKLSESLAKDYLLQQNLKFIANNYRCSYGEIDLIMLDVDTLVFVEVRSRKNYTFGHPIETIDSKKQSKLIKTATSFTWRHSSYKNQSLRFDAITMKTLNLNHNISKFTVAELSSRCDLTWYKNIIEL